MAKIGFIGMGNMGYAMMRGLLKVVDKADLIFADASADRVKKVYNETGVIFADSNAECAAKSQIVVLAVKPQFYPQVLKNIENIIKPNQILISIAPGYSIDRLKAALSDQIRIVRAMPNTPALVGEGMTGICYDETKFSAEEVASLEMIFSTMGRFKKVNENLMNAVTCASGSSPAYVFMFIEALADGVVACGMPRDMAYEFVAQTVLGSAKMVLDTKEHPGKLKDMVCSPAGTTIAGVEALEENGMRNALMKAVRACFNRYEEMNKSAKESSAWKK
ncbi:MAG: pyrroline-5-carboxylate reductase [Lachnospiraceae bacterium]|nr:pyrroline-5-carboxylate reductase [Lachnospiraceae bacterium]